MSLISLHRKYTFIDFQNRLCSIPALVTLVIVVSSVLLPFYIILKINDNEISSEVVKYEQPMVKFQYKYIFIAEHSMENGKVVICSSFSFLKNRNDIQKCSKLRISEKDDNFDGVPDAIHFTTEFSSMFNYGIKSISLVAFLDTRLYDACKLRVPSAIIYKKLFTNNPKDRKIIIDGSLQPDQKQEIICPFFLRNVKTHFFFEKIYENATKLEDFHISKVLDNLERNAIFFKFMETSTDQHEFNGDKTTFQIKMKIPEVAIRYRKTFWQKLNDVWMNYLAIFAVTFFLANLLLKYLFENHWLMARRKIEE